MATVAGANLSPDCSSIVVVVPPMPAHDAVGVDDGCCDGVADRVGDGRWVAGRVVAAGDRGAAGDEECGLAAGEVGEVGAGAAGWWRVCRVVTCDDGVAAGVDADGASDGSGGSLAAVLPPRLAQAVRARAALVATTVSRPPRMSRPPPGRICPQHGQIRPAVQPVGRPNGPASVGDWWGYGASQC